MSVTLKMADADAKLAADILTDVVKLNIARLDNQETVHYLRAIERRIPSHDMARHVMEIVGAFNVAVRSNQK